MKKRHGFGLLEVVLSAFLLSVGIFFATQMVLWGRVKLKETENRSFAMNLAAWKMEQYLAQSYSNLGTVAPPGATSTTPHTVLFLQDGLLMEQSGDSGVFHWASNITRMSEHTTDLTAAWRIIPYKRVEVIASYTDDDLKGTLKQRQIRLVNFMPYPFIHTAQVNFPNAVDSVTVPGPNAALPLDLNNPVSGHFQPIAVGTNGLRIHVSFETAKDVMVLYNIGINVLDPIGILPEHTLYTACFLDGAADPIPVVTRNPIMTQPSINNIVVLTEGFSLMPTLAGHDIEIRWFKEANVGTLAFKQGNIIIIAAEKL